jgi:hypothetical protein
LVTASARAIAKNRPALAAINELIEGQTRSLGGRLASVPALGLETPDTLEEGVVVTAY